MSFGLYNSCGLQVVADKTAYCLSKGLKVIVCIGETLEQREAGDTSKVVTEQMDAVAKVLGSDASKWQSIVIAYEPVWAIGTGKVATAEQVRHTTHSICSVGSALIVWCRPGSHMGESSFEEHSINVELLICLGGRQGILG